MKTPEDFKITFGEGGGFTGRWKGYTIAADGSVSAWQGRVAAQGAKPVGSLSAEQCATIWQNLNKSGFLDIEASEAGNMTRIIHVFANGREYKKRWPMTGSENENSVAVTIYNLCQRSVATLKEK